MKANRKPMPLLKKVMLTVILMYVGIILFVSYQIWHYLNIKPIRSSQIYFRDPFGTVYRDATRGCLDICFTRTYEKLPADRRTFEVLMVVSPFTRIHKPGEMTESRYAKDRTGVYWAGHIIRGSDTATFRAISYDLGKDQSTYYVLDKPLRTYLIQEFGEKGRLPEGMIDVLSYDASDFIVITVSGRYYYVKLNPQPKTIEEITGSSASRYPRIP
jgi:hypothetical protein